MRAGEVAKRYAKVLHDEVKKINLLEQALSEIRTLAPVFTEDAKIHDFFSSPVVSVEEKKAALMRACEGKVSAPVFSVLMMMAERSRLGLFKEFVSAYEQLTDQDHGVARGEVRSAAPLSEEAQKRMEAAVAKITGKKVIFTFKEDPNLLGGMVAQVDGWTFDDSLSVHLKRMNEDLNRRPN